MEWVHIGVAEIKFSPKFVKPRKITHQKIEISLKKLIFLLERQNGS